MTAVEFLRERRVPDGVRELKHILPAIVLLWVPVVLAVWGRLPGTATPAAGMAMLRAMLIGGLAPLMIATGIARLRARTWRGAGTVLWEDGWLSERPLRHLLMSVSLAAFFWAFACWKSAIPAVHGYQWDEPIWTAGALIHGGRMDQMLAPWFGSPGALIALDSLYETWWFVLLAIIMWQIWQPRLENAKRFLLAFALVWVVLGIFLATAFSSAGPCFSRLITGSHRYDDLVARLHAANAVSPLMALRGQAYLWEAYTQRLVPPGGGISAFPSLHVGGATLCAIVLWQRSRALGVVGWCYVALTWIASIMLGWHYALDGEVAVVAVALCWAVAGVLTTPITVAPRVTWRWRRADPALEPVPVPVRSEPPVSAGVRSSWSLWP
ncbi:MAG: phosphatase PAP2 family protein [Gemmatimonadales bacterium]